MLGARLYLNQLEMYQSLVSSSMSPWLGCWIGAVCTLSRSSCVSLTRWAPLAQAPPSLPTNREAYKMLLYHFWLPLSISFLKLRSPRNSAGYLLKGRLFNSLNYPYFDNTGLLSFFSDIGRFLIVGSSSYDFLGWIHSKPFPPEALCRLKLATRIACCRNIILNFFYILLIL